MNIKIGSKIPFGLSSIVMQNTKKIDSENKEIKEDVKNMLENQPMKDEFVKEDRKEIGTDGLTPQERAKIIAEEKNKQFQELINKPQKFHK